MAIVEHVDWDSRRRPTGKDDLPEVLKAWQSFAVGWQAPESARKPAKVIPITTGQHSQSERQGPVRQLALS